MLDKIKNWLESLWNHINRIHWKFSSQASEALESPEQILNNFLDINYDSKKSTKQMENLVKHLSGTEFSQLIFDKLEHILDYDWKRKSEVIFKILMLKNIKYSQIQNLLYDERFDFQLRQQFRNNLKSLLDNQNSSLPQGLLEFIQEDKNQKTLKVSSSKKSKSSKTPDLLQAKIDKYSKLAKENKL